MPYRKRLKEPLSRILILEQNKFDAQFLKSSLRLECEKATVVGSLADALIELSQGADRFDIVISDLELADSRGLETFQKLHQAEASLPILIVSRMNGLATLRAKLVSMGAQECLHKDDISPRKIQSIVKSCIERQKKIVQQIKMKELVEKQMDSKMRFLANFSHEIRTPLNTIIGNVSILEQSEASKLDRESIDNIKMGCSSLLKSVDDVLDLAKMNADQFDLLYDSVETHTKFSEPVMLYSNQAFDKKVYLYSTASVNFPTKILTDGHRLNQILNNFLSNALKYTHEGCIHMHLDLDRDTDELIITVSDSGRGLSEHSMRHLFDSFAQGKDTDAFNGTGLGLSICKLLANLFGGDVGAYNNEEVGATFWLRIPVQTIEENSDIPALKQKVTIVSFNAKDQSILFKQLSPRFPEISFAVLKDLGELSGVLAQEDVVFLDDFNWSQPQIDKALIAAKRSQVQVFSYWANREPGSLVRKTPFCQFRLIQLFNEACNAITKPGDAFVKAQKNLKEGVVLVCDDDDGNRNLLKRMLELDGMSCLQARNGLEAIQMVENYPEISLVLLDFYMPKLDGFEASKKIKQIRPDLSVIGLSGADLEMKQAEYDASGMEEFIQKPIRKGTIDSLLGRFFSNS